MPISVFIDCFCVLIGGLVGATIKDRLPARICQPLNFIFGICALGIGFYSFLKLHSLPAVILALVMGTFIGELINIDPKIKSGFKWGINHLNFKIHDDHDAYMSFYVVCAVTFCASGTNIFGAMNEGITGDMTILLSKAAMDVFASLIFATTLGYAITLIVIPQCLFLTLCFFLGKLIAPLISPEMFADFLAVGGLMTVALGLSIADIKRVNAANLLPSLVIAMPLSALCANLFP